MAVKINNTREYVFTEKDFNKLRKIANSHTGIIVTDDKYDMYYARLVKRIRTLGLASFADYVKYLDANMDSEFTPFIDSITTNLTSFFREPHHFEVMKSKIIPEISARPDAAQGIKVWSAGCSTGEEPYTLAITMLEGLEMVRPAPKVSILASDIDTTVLAKASRGIYEISRVEGLDSSIKRRWFFRGKGNNHGHVRVSPELQNILEFKQVNLMEKNWPMKNKFHIIFCRNVVIYFDKPTKMNLFHRYADQLVDGGYMILGHSESLQGMSDRFETIGKTVYKKIK
ncbi:MAG: protein-glutamate O-methyltransferase CheR [Gammaproteobacteria bacterium]|nr:protein-glutamate O-methyltransferase CheR [Gammaproteobacteria bacterium]MCW8910373.1 protein-glutamate O-methyltransferase CheR [Gammaproteobacteria bacterium]MCW9004837.1 protein-glutamate O-methyltransferase CheR [Gammaproteobacteria bacterium]MCW9056746.1 protein-glutamate O-methyltransferase CheR [Gammaproteobacteria bacterium]